MSEEVRTAEHAQYNQYKKRYTPRSPEDKKKLINRLNRAAGQLAGIGRMIENDAYCSEILIQSSAVAAALSAFNKEVLADHVNNCVADELKNGNTEITGELIWILQKLCR